MIATSRRHYSPLPLFGLLAVASLTTAGCHKITTHSVPTSAPPATTASVNDQLAAGDPKLCANPDLLNRVEAKLADHSLYMGHGVAGVAVVEEADFARVPIRFAADTFEGFNAQTHAATCGLRVVMPAAQSGEPDQSFKLRYTVQPDLSAGGGYVFAAQDDQGFTQTYYAALQASANERLTAALEANREKQSADIGALSAACQDFDPGRLQDEDLQRMHELWRRLKDDVTTASLVDCGRQVEALYAAAHPEPTASDSKAAPAVGQ